MIETSHQYLDIETLHSILFELLTTFHEFCEKHQIEYYLIAGTALGAKRHKGFIPWDDDIDVGMTRQHYESFIQLPKYFDDKYIVENYRNAKDVDYTLTRIYFNRKGNFPFKKSFYPFHILKCTRGEDYETLSILLYPDCSLRLDDIFQALLIE